MEKFTYLAGLQSMHIFVSLRIHGSVPVLDSQSWTVTFSVLTSYALTLKFIGSPQPPGDALGFSSVGSVFTNGVSWKTFAIV